MLCPLCGQRKARRACPGIGQHLCAVCCGTKRLAEIRCPDTCGYLGAAREHPAAIVRRQQERDFALLLPLLRHLSGPQQQLFLIVAAVITKHRPQGLHRLLDMDVADAAGALAQTFETAAKGLIIDTPVHSIPAQHLADDIKAFAASISKGGTRFELDMASVLRAVERGARDTPRDRDGGDAAFLALIARVVRHAGVGTGTAAPQADGVTPGPAAAPSLIIS